ncbi:EstA family serine hydrolase [Actinoplanes sp. N902-109]|uniref:EstA family serine hydrolase n=1 Tax=Actinoplanes sp. (strain N902-109) TaxID=649831 RepID=UPI0003294C72|nr:EstA family serine hydrolase [Actinoplanes sp. N902-109]AGL14137.1 beta-lactamase [Actinoplanes sp. N902-109]
MTDWLQLQATVQRQIDSLVFAGREVGVQVAAFLDGELIVNAVSGLADESTGAPVTPDTPFFSFSTGKGLTSTAVHVLAEKGKIDYDLRIADVWPEYGRHDKGRTTLRHALLHAAGVPALPSYTTPEDFLDWDRMCRTIAGSSPLWEPGTRHGFHEWTYGWLLGEVVRRATQRPIAWVLAEDVARPLGAERELFFGVPPQELNRVARLKDRNWRQALDLLSAHIEHFDAIAPPAVRPEAGLANRRDILQADIPAVATVSARGIARMYSALMNHVDGVRLITPDRLREITTVLTTGPDWAFGGDLPKTLGYAAQLGGTRFGWSGNGGSLAGFYPDLNLSVAVTKNYLGTTDDDPMEGIAAMIHAAVVSRNKVSAPTA